MIDIAPTFHPTADVQRKCLPLIVEEVARALSCEITQIDAIGRGQNLNYRLITTHPRYKDLLLRIISRRGYPSLKALQVCYWHLHRRGLANLAILHAGTASEYAPYGFFVQPWIMGECAADIHENGAEDLRWLDACLPTVIRVYEISLPFFGYLGEGPQYPTLQEYFDHMDVIVDHSFGQVTPADFTIWELDELGITSPSFLTATFETVSKLARRIDSPVRAVLVHGDVFPANLIYTKEGTKLIDWDEARANWWVYDLARILFYYPNPAVVGEFVSLYRDQNFSPEELEIGIRLEHTRQYLRQICTAAFGDSTLDDTRHKAARIESRISEILHNA